MLERYYNHDAIPRIVFRTWQVRVVRSFVFVRPARLISCLALIEVYPVCGRSSSTSFLINECNECVCVRVQMNARELRLEQMSGRVKQLSETERRAKGDHSRAQQALDAKRDEKAAAADRLARLQADRDRVQKEADALDAQLRQVAGAGEPEAAAAAAECCRTGVDPGMCLQQAALLLPCCSPE